MLCQCKGWISNCAQILLRYEALLQLEGLVPFFLVQFMSDGSSDTLRTGERVQGSTRKLCRQVLIWRLDRFF